MWRPPEPGHDGESVVQIALGETSRRRLVTSDADRFLTSLFSPPHGSSKFVVIDKEQITSMTAEATFVQLSLSEIARNQATFFVSSSLLFPELMCRFVSLKAASSCQTSGYGENLTSLFSPCFCRTSKSEMKFIT